MKEDILHRGKGHYTPSTSITSHHLLSNFENCSGIRSGEETISDISSLKVIKSKKDKTERGRRESEGKSLQTHKGFPLTQKSSLKYSKL